MKSGSSADISSGGQSADAFPTSSSYHRSRPSFIGTSPPVRRTTSTLSTRAPWLSARSIARSAFVFSGTARPPRTPSSAVMRKRDPQSSMRPASASGEKPPKTTEWTAPIRAQASIA
jgi:hypothetical protein